MTGVQTCALPIFNNYLQNITTKIYRHYNQLSDAGAEISALLLKEYNEGKNDPKQYLIEAFHLNNQLMEKEKGSKYTSDTIKRYRISIERLKLDGLAWTEIGSPLKMEYTLPHFMGFRFGLFNYSTKEAGGFVDLDWFRIN